MNFIVDSQLPPALAMRLTALGHPSWHIDDILALDASDREICSFARARGWVVITKDADFLRLVASGSPALLSIRVGNCRTARLLDIVCAQIDTVAATFAAGTRIVALR